MNEYEGRQCGSQQSKCQVYRSIGSDPRVERDAVFSVLVLSAHEFEPPVAIVCQPRCDEVGCEPLTPFALHRHATPYRHNCECNIGASEGYENEGFSPKYSAIMTFERIEEIAIPVVQQ